MNVNANTTAKMDEFEKEGAINPDMAFLYPIINGWLIDLPIFYIQIYTMIQLAGNPNF